MNPYRLVERLAPGNGQRFAVVAYALSREPYPDPEDPAPAASAMASGIFVFLRAFDNAIDALNYARSFLNNAQLRNVTVVRANRWKHLTTHVRLDQTSHEPLAIDRAIAQSNELDLDAYHPTYRLRTHATERAEMARRAPDMLATLALAVSSEDEDLETLRTLVAHHERRRAEAAEKLAAGVANVSRPIDMLREEEPVARAIVGDAIWMRLLTTVNAAAQSSEASSAAPAPAPAQPTPPATEPLEDEPVPSAVHEVAFPTLDDLASDRLVAVPDLPGKGRKRRAVAPTAPPPQSVAPGEDTATALDLDPELSILG